MPIRRAQREDAEAMAAVIAVVAEEGSLGTEPPVDLEARTELFREAIAEEGRSALWVLEDGDRVLGFAAVRERTPGVLHLGMAILPAARGQGAGRALLDATVDHARACGAHKLDLEVWTDNARAIALYVSAGFEVEGLRRRHYLRRDGSLRSALIMAQLI